MKSNVSFVQFPMTSFTESQSCETVEGWNWSLNPPKSNAAHICSESHVVYSINLRFWSAGFLLNLDLSPLSLPLLPWSTQSSSCIWRWDSKAKTHLNLFATSYATPILCPLHLPFLSISLSDTKTDMSPFICQGVWKALHSPLSKSPSSACFQRFKDVKTK